MSGRPPLPGGPYLIVGLGRSGVAAELALDARGEGVIGVDCGAPDVQALDGLETHLRTDGVEFLNRVRTVVKSPGVPRDAPVIAGARKLGLNVIGELELAWRLLSNEFIAVTGTNGKTTTAELIGRIHREAGRDVAVAGNVGLALSGLVAPPGQAGPGLSSGRTLPPGATVVCEASSFQLEDTIEFAPDAAVLLNLSGDHLDRHGSMKAYRAAKLEIFARQAQAAVAVAPAGLAIPGGAARRIRFGSGPRADLRERDGSLWWRSAELIGVGEIRLRGLHNRLNAMAAAAVTLARGIPPAAVRAGLQGFAGVPHRLEEVATVGGVLYVNDSKATNVAGTLVALDSFPPGSVHLILGGRGKGQSFEALRDRVSERCAGVYLIGEDAPVLAEVLQRPRPLRSGDLDRALNEARTAATPGQVILLSPACASFDQFADFEQRGDRFRQLVEPAPRRAQA